MAPSTRNTTRSAYAAAPGSWVTITTVWPRSSTTERRKREQLGPGLGVERAGGLVGEDDVGAVDEGPGHGDPLLLATGQLGGPVAQPVAEVELRDHGRHPRRSGVAAGEIGGQGDVLLGGEGGQQVERLEDEPEPVPTQDRALPVREGGQVGVADEHLPRGQRVQAGQAVHQGRLARARRTHDRGELAGGQVEASGRRGR